MSTDTQPPESDPRERKRYYLEDTLLRRLLTALLRQIFRLFTVIEASGVEHLPERGGLVLAANHLNEYDVFPMQFVLPRLIFFMGKAELFKNPFLDPVLRRLGGFPVYRSTRDEWAIQHAQQILDRGMVLGIFPEGKRSQGRGLRAAKTGAARFALHADVPIVPLAVVGTDQMFANFPRRTKVNITIGEPIYPQHDESPLELTDRLMFTLAEMLPLRLRGVYSERPPGF
jgi:1-acyl-sn-glycerol-3-phosphate acyltransferase